MHRTVGNGPEHQFPTVDDTSTHVVVDGVRDREATAEHATVSERSQRIAKINGELVDAGISCFDVWPLHRFDQDVDQLGGIAWTLNAIGDCARPATGELLVVVMRLTTMRYLAWVRDGSHGLVSIFSVASERKFRAIVEDAQGRAE